jgi:hypothetical protein
MYAVDAVGTIVLTGAQVVRIGFAETVPKELIGWALLYVIAAVSARQDNKKCMKVSVLTALAPFRTPLLEALEDYL